MRLWRMTVVAMASRAMSDGSAATRRFISSRSALQKRSLPQLLKEPWSPVSRTVSKTSLSAIRWPPQVPSPMLMPAAGYAIDTVMAHRNPRRRRDFHAGRLLFDGPNRINQIVLGDAVGRIGVALRTRCAVDPLRRLGLLIFEQRGAD